MLFKVEMNVNIPLDADPDAIDALKKKEKEYSQTLQRDGKWRHIWRVAGQYANVSIFDVESNEELHDLLLALPLYPYMEMKVEALCRHPSSIREDDR